MTGAAVLLSLGRNPVSGRPRLPPSEAAAIALLLRAGLRPRLVHAGPAADAAPLRRGVGLGGTALEILDIAPDADPLDALLGHLVANPPELVATGRRAERGEGSGLLPFLVAQALDRPLVPDCVWLAREAGGTVALSRAGKGLRRRVGLPSCGAVLVLPSNASSTTLGSVRATNTEPVVIHAAAAPRDARHAAPPQPARRVPPRLEAPHEQGVGQGRTLTDAEAAAAEVLAHALPPTVGGARGDHPGSQGQHG